MEYCYLVTKLCPTLFVTPWTVACKAPLSTGFWWQEYWSGLQFPSPPPCSLDTLTSSTYLGLRKWVQMCQVGCKIAMESLLGKEHWKKCLVKYHNTPGSRNLSSVYWRRTVKTWVPQGTWLHSRGTNITPSFPAPHHEGRLYAHV